MLLELLNHHEDLLRDVIRPLIGARKAADLAHLAASCRQMNSVIITIDFYKHCKLFQKCLKNINAINILSNSYVTIRDHNNILTILRCYEPNKRKINIFKYDMYSTYFIWNSKFNYKSYIISHSTDRIIIRSNIYTNNQTCYIHRILPPWLQKYNNHFPYTFAVIEDMKDDIYYSLYT